MRSAGAVFGLLDVDDEFFVIVRPAPSGTRLLLSDATAALDYDIAAEVLEKLDADIDAEELEDADPFEEGDLGRAGGHRPARGGAGRDPRRDAICTPTNNWAGSRGRWASPTNCRRCSTAWVGETDEDLIRAALEAARAAGPRDVPIGAVVVAADGTELARAANAREELGDPTAHAEILAMRAAASVLGDGWRLEGTTLAVTVEPCTMCAGALVMARVARLVFGAWEPKTGAVGSLWDVVRDRRLTHRPEVRGGVLADECAAPLEAFFARSDDACATAGVIRIGDSLRSRGPTRFGRRALVGKLPHGGVSERPKEHASKACDG